VHPQNPSVLAGFPEMDVKRRPTLPKQSGISSYPQEIPTEYQQVIPKKFSKLRSFFLRGVPGVGHALNVDEVFTNQLGAAKTPRDRRGRKRGFSDLPAIGTGSGKDRRLPLAFGRVGHTAFQSGSMQAGRGFGSYPSPKGLRVLRQPHLARECGTSGASQDV